MGSLRDIYNQVKEFVSLLPLIRTVDANGTGVDTRGYNGGPVVMFIIGAPGDTLSGSIKIQARLEESDDDVTYTAVAADDILDGTQTNGIGAGSNGEFGHVQDVSAGNNGSQVITCGYRGTKRYIRVVDDRTGTHTTGTSTAAIVQLTVPSLAGTRAAI